MLTPCHRCLLPFVSSSEHPHVSLRIAKELLDEILKDWAVEAVDTLSGVRIDQLVDSELEDRFVRTLITWGRRDEEDGSASAKAGQGGVEHELRFTRGDAATRWRMRDHVRMNTSVPSEPDFLLERTDGPAERVAVFLDGFAFHASEKVNRLADDASKRAALRADGVLVWQLTWDDVMTWAAGVSSAAEGQQVRAHARPLHTDTALQLARQIHQSLVGQARPDDTLDPVLRNPVETLLEFLADPDRAKWARRAAGLLGGFGAAARPQLVDREEAGRLLPDVLRGANLPASASANEAVAFDARTTGQTRIIGLLDRRPEPRSKQPDMRAWSALAVLDDRAEAITGDGHKDRWTDWLRWSNLLQFLQPAAGDELPRSFHQVAVSTSDQVDPHTVALLTSALPTEAGAPQPLPQAWTEAIEWASSQVEDVLLALVKEARSGRIDVPEVGFEYGDQAIQAELAWPDKKVAVFIDLDERRDALFARDGWYVAQAGAVNVTELIKKLEGN
ncbi:hypothetical protein ACIOWI_35315 [Streptomyces sp. NPDC087659]|uniref:hypothetical protein n=1 Tax=Streptomyces sp. NPDC087659 TaxID=3365801 RepID=UPI0038294B5D